MMAEQNRCPSSGLLAEFVDGRSPPAQRAEVTAHIAGCPECYEVVVGTASFVEQGEPALAEVRPFRGRRLWLATAAAVTVAATVSLLSLQIWTRDPVERLASAARSGGFRPSEGRLAGFAWAPTRPATRALILEETDPSLLRIRGVAGEVLEQEESSTDRRSLHAVGIAHLLVGHERRAVEKLEEATRQDPRNAELWSDLAAARLAQARDEDSPELFPEALAAADTALDLDSDLSEGLFNRARALDAMRLNRPATEAYQRFLGVESGSPWAEEARQRIRELKAGPQPESWKQAIPRLEKLAAADDAAGIRSIVAAFPQEARTWGETEWLGEWAAAEQKGERDRAVERLRLARMVGDALVAVNGEPILRQAVAAIDGSDDGKRKLLATAHESYRTGRNIYSRQEFTQAQTYLESSRDVFSEVGSPMWMLASFYATVAAQIQSTEESALAVLRTLRSDVPNRCRALRALISWQEGTLLGRQRRIHEGVDAYRASLADFEAIGERENAARVRAHLADALEFSGDSSEAWHHRIASFGTLSVAPDANRLQFALSTIAAEFFREERYSVAAAVSGVATKLPADEATDRRKRADAFLWHALALHALHDSRAAVSLQAAKEEAALIPATPLRESAWSDIAFVESRLIDGRDPARAVELLSSVLAEPNQVRRFFAKPEVLLARSRCLAALGRREEALSDLRNAAEFITAAQRSDQRQISPAVASDVFDELITALAASGKVAETFRAADAARTHAFFERLRESSLRREHRDLDVHQIQDLTPADTLVLEYVSLPDGLLIIAADRSGAQLHRVPIRADELQGLIGQWVRTLSTTAAKSELLSERIGQILIGPISARLEAKQVIVVSLDPRLGPVPLAAVRYHGSYLIESFEVLVVPSVSLWASGSLEPECLKPSALVVGNPAFDRRMFPELLPLAEAQWEAVEVAKMYSDSIRLTGPAATRRAVLEQLPRHCILHVASHAVSSSRDPAYSFLLLGEEKEESGRLYGYEIAKLNLKSVSLVVLAGCKTAAPSPSDSFPSLTSAFLAAGARSSIGTLWNTEDRVAHEFSLRLHRSLRAGRSVSSVVRDVQLSMLRSSDVELRTPRAWGAFQLITAGS